MKPLRTPAEEQAGRDLAAIFEQSADATQAKLEAFPRYARRKTVTRFITLYELFKLALDVKGSIIECGVFRGFGLMTWAHLSAVLEPANLTRRIYGFDSFEGFPEVGEQDRNAVRSPEAGGLRADAHAELTKIVGLYNQDRFLGHVDKVSLIKGDVTKTIPEFMQQHQHLVVSLLFLDLDLYAPTRIALEQFVPRMPKGAVIAFDELDNPIWPGETRAAVETIGLNALRVRRFAWDPYIGYAVIE
ncbi:MAG: class I SAM-dependent methyltransferase [Acidobacteria bacterium]|nr:class I SAM-dependent methyltransferase [Acidobacteriota bacterium]